MGTIDLYKRLFIEEINSNMFKKMLFFANNMKNEKLILISQKSLSSLSNENISLLMKAHYFHRDGTPGRDQNAGFLRIWNCRGGACPARRRTAAINRLSLKWQKPKVCHCEEANGRRGALSAKREEVPLGCNLGKALTILPIALPRSSRVLRDCHVASLLAMTHQGGAAVHQCSPAVEFSCTGRSLPVKGTPHP